MVPARLQSIGYTVGRATAAVGQLGNAWAVIYVPNTFTAALATSLVPALAESWTRRDWPATVGRIGQTLRMTGIVCFPAAAGLWALAGEICTALYGTGTASDALRTLAPASFFLGLLGVCTGALQGLGHTVVPVKNFALGFLVKVALTGLLCGSPSFGPRGAALGTVLGAALAAVLTLDGLARRVNLPANIYGALLKSGLAAGVMTLGLAWLKSLPFIAAMNDYFRLALLLPLGVAVFTGAFWLVGGVEAGDVEYMRRAKRKVMGWVPR
jgi:stage V sporulation protein B